MPSTRTISTLRQTTAATTFLLALLASSARADDGGFIGRFDLRGRISSGAETRVLLEVTRDGRGLLVHRTAWVGREAPLSWTTRDVTRDGAALCARFPIDVGMAGRLAGEVGPVLTARYVAEGSRVLETAWAPVPWLWRWSKALGRRIDDGEVPMRADHLEVHGDSSERYDIVFVAEGYQAHELPRFRAAVARALKQLRKTSPYDRYWGYLNLHVVDVASRRSGIMAQPGGLGTRGHGDDMPDIDRDRAAAAAELATHAPEAVVIITNDDFRSKAQRGMCIASALDRDFDIVVVHELCHVVGQLLDEYVEMPASRWDFIIGSAWTKGILEYTGWGANITVLSARDEVPWRRWMTVDAPIPTLPGSGVRVGMYEGGMWRKRGVYRPSEQCLMGPDHAQPLCPVCREAVVLRLSKATFPMHLETVQLDRDTWRLRVVTDMPGTPRFTWRRNGIPVGDGTSTFVARRGDLPWGESELTVEVEDTTDFVRADDHLWSSYESVWILDKGYAYQKGLRVRGPWRYQAEEPAGEDNAAHLERLFGM